MVFRDLSESIHRTDIPHGDQDTEIPTLELRLIALEKLQDKCLGNPLFMIMDREGIQECRLKPEYWKIDLADIDGLRLFLEDTKGIRSLFFLTRYDRTEDDLMARRYDDFFRDILRIDDELEWDRVVHHDELEGLLSSDHPVIPRLILSHMLHDIPIVCLDYLFPRREYSIPDIVESITDTDDRPKPLERIDRLVDTSTLAYDSTRSRIEDIADILEGDDFSHFFLELLHNFVHFHIR